MTTLREAAKQALEVLIRASSYYDTYAEIDALRAALDQHDKDRVWIEERKANWALQRKLVAETPERDKQQQEYEEARSTALEQEPVAWIQSNHLQLAQRGPFSCRVEPTQRHPDFVPLYTRPTRREWRGLTEEDRSVLFSTHFNSPYELVNAIEAALKEKNHE
jgi:hypothetical protein